MKFIVNKEELSIIIYLFKTYCIGFFTYYMAMKSMNINSTNKYKKYIIYIAFIFVSVVSAIIKYVSNMLSSLAILIIMLSCIFSKDTKNNLGKSIFIIAFSLSINYILYIIAEVIIFFPCAIMNIRNDYFAIISIIIMYVILAVCFLKIKRFKNGFAFLKDNMQGENMNVLMLNICVTILFIISAISGYTRDSTLNFVFQFVICAVIMFVTIQESLQLYYKQKLLIKELEETKGELAKKTKEIEDLEAENIAISKKTHTLTHKQKSLEYKLQEIINKTEISKEEVGEVSDRIKEIEKDLYKEKTTIELSKTGIAQIDDMLKYMQSECKKNKIDFELQIKGNIHYMTNNLISTADIETLLADHIKNAIIAINHTDNVNRSILVRLGEIDGNYSLYIYDSGIEFEKETLENLGKKPSTTHANEGGTGMGFMNTFDTLRKCKASLIIEEYNEPSKDNYTKALMIKFDNKNEFEIKSYRRITL